jgi:DNA (cytosine-5)-methyltransferase 1
MNISIFDVMYPDYKIDKPIRLIELFAGVGSQAMALRNLGADFEHYRVVEFDKYAIASYNAIHDTNFETMDITEVKGEDLEIVDTDKYTYIMTYSFPCQDLSVAGKMKGMTKDSGTRSGLLWEVERLLNEVENLPQVLLMENVPQVISDANIKDFQLWQQFLEEKGYSNYTEILNAKDYGVAQNRERCFMVSLLGEWNYKFPQPIPLTKIMKDYLEDEVDEKYYIKSEKAQKLIQQLIESGQLSGCIGNVNPSGNGINGNVFSSDGLVPTLTTNKGEGPKICTDLSINNPKVTDISNCITARQDRGISNHQGVGGAVIEKSCM